MAIFKRKNKGLVGNVSVRSGEGGGGGGTAVAEKSTAPAIPSIADISRVRRVIDGELEGYDGSRCVVWQVGGCDIMDPQSVSGWMLVLNSLEFPIQVLIRQHCPDYSDIRSDLLEVRPDHMREGFINDVGNSMLEFLLDQEEGHNLVTRSWYIIAKADRLLEVASTLTQGNFNATRLVDSDLEALLQGCYSGMRSGHVQDEYQAKVGRGDIQLNYRHMSVYEVNRWPRRVSFLFLEQLLRTGEEMDVSIWVWPVSLRESHTQLIMQRSRFEGARLAAEQKGRLVPPEVELAIADIVRISDGVERGVNRLFRRTMTVAVYAPDRDRLREVQQKLVGHFRASISSVRRLDFRQDKGLAAMMPMLRPGLGEPDLTDGETMGRMFPFGPPDLDRREGTLLGTDLRSRTSVFVDPFSAAAMNGHMVVMARSGAGKSFFTKLRVLRMALRGIPVYLIDPEGEYGVITRTLGGDVFVPGSPGYGLNPFMVGYTNRGDLAKRVSSLCSLVGVMLEGELDQDMKAIIDRSLMGFYGMELRKATDQDRILGKGGMIAICEYLESEEAKKWGGPRLAHLLSTFATGSAQFLMSGDARDLIGYEAPVTAFNLKNLPNRLKPVATSVCSEVVWGLAVTNPRPRILVVDECWTVLSTPSGAEALLTIVKRARKYQLGLMAITQDVQDFLAEDSSAGLITGHAGKALLQNSALKLALQQDAAALPLVQTALGLNDDVAGFLAGSVRGQGVLVGERGDCYPLDIVSTAQERTVVLDQSWRRDGDVGEEDNETVLEALGDGSGGSEVVGARVRSGSGGGVVEELGENLEGMLEEMVAREREGEDI